MRAPWRATSGPAPRLFCGVVIGPSGGASDRGKTPEPFETLMANPFQFLQDVRAEGAKITWPSRRETLITTGLVLAMVFVASLFFVTVDQTLRLIVGFLLSLGR